MTTPDNQRRDYSGGAVITYLTTGIGASDTSITVVDATSFPAASASKFAAVVIDEGLNNEETIFYSPKVTNTLTNCIRGADGSTQTTHAVGASVRHVHTALDANEANRHVTDVTRNDHTQYLKKDVSNTVSGVTTFSANQIFNSTAAFNGDVTSATNLTANNFTATTVTGNPAFSGTPVFAHGTFTASPTMPMGGTPATITGSTAAAGVSVKPAREDHVHAIATAVLNALVPIGAELSYPVTITTDADVPDNFLYEDGRAVSRTTYSALFAKYGTTHGSGDGTTTFNIPDRRGRSLVGKDGSHALGATGGATTHSLSTAELAAHTHSITDPTHTHGVDTPNDTGNRIAVSHTSTYGATGTSITQALTLTNLNPASTGITGTNSTGSGTAFSIESPWGATNWIVRAL
jgi:microcystin-dependent protein